MSNELTHNPGQFDEVIHIIDNARSRAMKAVNAELIQMYWSVGEYLSELKVLVLVDTALENHFKFPCILNSYFLFLLQMSQHTVRGIGYQHLRNRYLTNEQNVSDNFFPFTEEYTTCTLNKEDGA